MTRTIGDNVQTGNETLLQNNTPRCEGNNVSIDQQKYTINNGDNMEIPNHKMYQKVCQVHRDNSPRIIFAATIELYNNYQALQP